VLLLLASIAVGYVVYQQLQGPAGVKVPDVSGAPEAAAKQTLEGDGFKVGPSQHKASATIQSGFVISTKPAAGDTAPKGSTVTLVVSTGPKSVTLPDLRGQPLADALKKLSDLGLPPGAPVQISSKLPSGEVVRTNPPPGVIDPTTVVTLFVSNGNVRVPNVVGMTCAQATTTLQGFNLQANCVDAPSDTAPAGQVFAESPSAGQPAPQGGTVDLQVSTGPAQVQVPDTTNTDYNSAKHLLHQQGLHALRQDCLASDPTIPDGVVVASDPPPGTMVDPKSTVTLYVQDSTSTTPCP
jgi:eukaryotic-like serine/threonine-protein kinase